MVSDLHSLLGLRLSFVVEPTRTPFVRTLAFDFSLPLLVSLFSVIWTNAWFRFDSSAFWLIVKPGTFWQLSEVRSEAVLRTGLLWTGMILPLQFLEMAFYVCVEIACKSNSFRSDSKFV